MNFRFLIASVLVTCAAQAEEARRTSISVERLVGYSILSVDVDGDKEDVNAISLAGIGFSPLAAPRLGVDYRFGTNLTVGGAAAYSNARVDDLEASFYLAQLRGGYSVELSPTARLIPRVALGWGGVSLDERSNADTLSVTALTVEAVGRVNISPGFFLLAALSYDTVLSGDFEEERDNGFDEPSTRTNDLDASVTTLQFWFGLGGDL